MGCQQTAEKGRICRLGNQQTWQSITGWWFGTFFIFHNVWDNPSHWLIFFKMVQPCLKHQPDHVQAPKHLSTSQRLGSSTVPKSAENGSIVTHPRSKLGQIVDGVTSLKRDRVLQLLIINTLVPWWLRRVGGLADGDLQVESWKTYYHHSEPGSLSVQEAFCSSSAIWNL